MKHVHVLIDKSIVFMISDDANIKYFTSYLWIFQIKEIYDALTVRLKKNQKGTITLNTQSYFNTIVQWNMISITLLLVLFPLLIYWLYKSSKVPKGLTDQSHWSLVCICVLIIDFPPGPGRLPVVGSLLSIPNASGVLVACTQWFIKRYGKLVRT